MKVGGSAERSIALPKDDRTTNTQARAVLLSNVSPDVIDISSATGQGPSGQPNSAVAFGLRAALQPPRRAEDALSGQVSNTTELVSEIIAQVWSSFESWNTVGNQASPAGSLPGSSGRSEKASSQHHGQSSPGNNPPGKGTKRTASQEPPGKTPKGGPRAAITATANKADANEAKLACPFWKKNPERYRPCIRGFTRVKDVKEHLRRKHKQPPYCQRCCETFPNAEELRTHTRNRDACEVRPEEEEEEPDGLRPEQIEALSIYSKRAKPADEQWFDLWDNIFPGRRRPRSPYVDGDLSDDALCYEQFVANQGADIIISRVAAAALPEGVTDVVAVQVRRGLDELADKWRKERLASRGDAGTPPGSQSNTPDSAGDEATPITVPSTSPSPKNAAQAASGAIESAAAPIGMPTPTEAEDPEMRDSAYPSYTDLLREDYNFDFVDS